MSEAEAPRRDWSEMEISIGFAPFSWELTWEHSPRWVFLQLGPLGGMIRWS